MASPTTKIENFERLNNRVAALQFPSDLGSDRVPRYLEFFVYAYKKPSLNAFETEVPKGSIALPIPSNLQQASSMSYTDKEAGATGIVGSGAQGSSSLFDIPGIAGQVAGSIKGTIQSELAERGFDTGVVTNPHVISRFQNVGFRTYSFEYLMIARNQKESNHIYEIVRKFEYHSHPDFTTNGLNFIHPDVFKIKLKPTDQYLFKTNICALTGMDVTYNGTGLPVFYKDTGAPVEVKLTMEFKEMTYDTKQSLQKKYKGS